MSWTITQIHYYNSGIRKTKQILQNTLSVSQLLCAIHIVFKNQLKFFIVTVVISIKLSLLKTLKDRIVHYPPQPKKDVNSEYNNLLPTIQKVLNKHAPLKSRIIKGNQAAFMNKELSKAIMKRSQLKTKYNKTKQEADRNAYKKQRNLCVKLGRKPVK